MTDLVIKVVLAYLLGSVSGSLLLGKFRGVDIRKSGSGNAGGTNAFRTQGVLFALGVVIIDIGKGALAAAWLPNFSFPSLGTQGVGLETILLCGAAAIIGHCYPLYHGFRGGKGAGTLVGALAVIAPMILLPMLGLWLIVLILTGYVGLATITAGLGMFITVLVQEGLTLTPMSAFAAFMALFLIFTHRSNISKLRNGTEHRFERAYFKNWFN